MAREFANKRCHVHLMERNRFMTFTADQIDAIRQGEPIRLIPPEIGEECVVLRAAEFEDITRPSQGPDPKQAYAAIDEAWKEDWERAGDGRIRPVRGAQEVKHRRGELVLVYYPFSSGAGGSRRPALVVQSDDYNAWFQNTIVAQITTNLARASDHAHHLVRVATAEGKESGLLQDSVVSCINLATVLTDRIQRVIGRLPNESMEEIDACLAVALNLTAISADANG